MASTSALKGEKLRKVVERAVAEVKVTDVHTHLYAPCFGKILLSGIDELLTYHYLVAETFRWIDIPYKKYWAMPKLEQADLVWDTLFKKSSPISEATRGVLTSLQALGLDTGSRDLKAYRKFFASQEAGAHLTNVMTRAGLKDVVMTNDPFDDLERPIWLQGYKKDARFRAALRIDPLLMDFPNAIVRMKEWGYIGEATLNPATVEVVKKFLRDWVVRMDALYMAVSLPPTFKYPDDSVGGRVLRDCILPVCRELNIPMALMIGVKKRTNPELLLGGDSVGKGDIDSLERLLAQYPKNKFLVTYLSRENQHEVCIVARKFRNMLLFGCWWFVNNPSIIAEITLERLETLGGAFVPQHSDARVLEQVLYKWSHSRKIIAKALVGKYQDAADSGWGAKEDEIRRDVARFFGGNFWDFLALKLS